MPLRDHFHPPLHPRRSWESLHTAWSTVLMFHLNEQLLPVGYYSDTQVHIGNRVEVDVATLEEADPNENGPTNGRTGTAVAEAVWAPPAPPLVLDTVFTEQIEVQVFGTRAGIELVAAIELVSPSNKDRPETRQAFASKCSSYLQSGVGLLIVDLVTDRLANLHNELLGLLNQPETAHLDDEISTYAVAYRPVHRAAGAQIDCWPTALALGQVLPLLPLALRGGPTLPLDLEVTYTEACRRSRL